MGRKKGRVFESARRRSETPSRSHVQDEGHIGLDASDTDLLQVLGTRGRGRGTEGGGYGGVASCGGMWGIVVKPRLFYLSCFTPAARASYEPLPPRRWHRAPCTYEKSARRHKSTSPRYYVSRDLGPYLTRRES